MAGFAAELGNHTISDLISPTVLEERGRKRRRTSDDVTSPPVAHHLSGESTTLRGRGRRRSASGTSLQSDDTSKPPLRTKSQPLRKYQRKILPREPQEKKRSQSPSRSRSKDRNRTPRRRRQRTTTRSRSHEAEKGSKHLIEEDGLNHNNNIGVEAVKI